ncbi:hypothetical protein [Rhodanobacter lindaniclasticus]
MLAGPRVRYFESFDLIKLVYPVRYGLRNAYPAERLNEYLHIHNRLFVVQYDTPHRLKTLLVSPSDHERGGETPFFRRLQDATPKFIVDRLVTRYASVPEVLARIGLRDTDIDYITYDHLHTQDVRRWLGSAGQPAMLPNAKLLVHQHEWANAQDLSPYQRDWYCPHGVAGIAADKVLCFNGSVMLGDGIAHFSAHAGQRRGQPFDRGQHRRRAVGDQRERHQRGRLRPAALHAMGRGEIRQGDRQRGDHQRQHAGELGRPVHLDGAGIDHRRAVAARSALPQPLSVLRAHAVLAVPRHAARVPGEARRVHGRLTRPLSAAPPRSIDTRPGQALTVKLALPPRQRRVTLRWV